MKISKKVDRLPPSGIREFFDLVIGMKEVISLGVGEPDFTTPWNIRETAIYSLEQGYTSYTSNRGLYELRLEISRFLKSHYSLDYSPDEEILITVGVSEAFDLALRALINPGDKVIVPEPSYVSYAPVSILAGGEVLYLKTDKEGGFKIDPQKLDKICDRKAKYLVLNYPCNPTGVSYTKKELNDIKKVVIKKNLTVISDEVYDELTYDFSHIPLAKLDGMKSRTIYLNGFSKAYAMTGWRVGFAAGPAKAIAGMTKIHQYTMLCAPITGQIAAREALKNGTKSVEQMRNEYRRRRDFIVKELCRIGLDCHRPQGAFYVFPSIKKTGMKSVEFAKELLKREKVAVVPGVAFGPSGEGYVRMSYATSLSNIKEAVSRIEHFLK